VKLRTKLTLIPIAAVVLGTVAGNIFALLSFLRIFEDAVLLEQEYQFELRVARVDGLLETIQDVANSLTVDPEVQSYLRARSDAANGQPDGGVRRSSATARRLGYLISLQSTVESATLVDDLGYEVWTSYPWNIFAPDTDIAPTSTTWPATPPPQFIGPYNVFTFGQDILHIGRVVPVHDVQNPRTRIGTLILHTPRDALLDIESSVPDSPTRFAIIVGGVAIQPEVSTAPQPTDVMMSARSSVAEDVWFEAVVPASIFRERLNSVLVVYLIVVILAVTVCAATLLPLVLRTLRPLHDLHTAVSSATRGDLSARTAVRSDDEFGILARRFNEMLAQIDTLIHVRVESERKVQSLEYDLLVAQINPHFLYNTLTAVKILSQTDRKQAVAEVTDSLIKILHSTLGTSSSKLMTTLDEELRLVEQYLTIQRYQYPTLFTVSLEISEPARSCTVPTFVLQPLVENAIFHGLRPRGAGGKISIAAHMEDSKLKIRVADNGVGSDASGTSIEGSRGRGMKSIGLANIRSRIDYHYGIRGNVDIQSDPGQGFSVSISIPVA
jgi:HAMP domain-containing protein